MHNAILGSLLAASLALAGCRALATYGEAKDGTTEVRISREAGPRDGGGEGTADASGDARVPPLADLKINDEDTFGDGVSHQDAAADGGLRTLVFPTLSARTQALGTFTGSTLIIWGGRASRFGHCGQGDNVGANALGDGAQYNLTTHRWASITAMGAPSPRFASAPLIWTGSEALTWGACTFYQEGHDDGAAYNPQSDSWRPIATLGAPSKRGFHSAVWTGTQMVVWGGHSGSFNSPLADGAAYDPMADSWERLASTGAPSARHHHSAVWTGSEMIVWGGQTTWNEDNSTNTDGRYVPGATFSYGSWAATSTVGAPSPRSWQTAIWTGQEMIIWGGRRKTGPSPGGAAYNPMRDSWRAISAVDAPPPTYRHAALWTGDQMLVFGGCCSPTEHYYLYDPARDMWTRSQLKSALFQRYGMVAAWVGDGFVFAGGTSPSNLRTHHGDGAYVPM